MTPKPMMYAETKMFSGMPRAVKVLPVAFFCAWKRAC